MFILAAAMIIYISDTLLRLLGNKEDVNFYYILIFRPAFKSLNIRTSTFILVPLMYLPDTMRQSKL